MSPSRPSSTMQQPQHLEPSQLGTKEYWDNFYANSLEHLSSKSRRPNAASGIDNHKQDAKSLKPLEAEGNGTGADDDDHNNDSNSDEDVDDDSDPGTSWFTEHNAPEKVLDFLCSPDFPLAPESLSDSANQATSILDLGTGNGTMLSLLRQEGDFTGPLVGVDYSLQSIELARRLHGDDDIRFEVWDVFDQSKGVEEHEWYPKESDGFNIVLDKGTFDAISLSAEEVEVPAAGAANGDPGTKRRICELYPEICKRLLCDGGYLVVTSCNWTEDELITWFTKPSGREGDLADSLVVFDRVEYPKFRFGGREGQGVCTVCFQRAKTVA